LTSRASAEKPASKANHLVDGTKEEDNEFLEAKHCLMIFRGF
jgi:hypothetical protein